jgi:RecA-family ATPase
MAVVKMPARGEPPADRFDDQGEDVPPDEQGKNNSYEQPKASPFKRLGVADIFAPLPPVPWLVQALDLCPGAASLFAGYGFSGKTVAVQDLALAVATGTKAWGTFNVRPGRVLHIDYEQGRRLTFERYQRLAAYRMIAPTELAESLSVVALPAVYLDTLGMEAMLTRECEGHALVVVDSLRAAAPTIEENDSGVRCVLDLLSRVSEKTGCVPIVIHHARKPSQDKTGGAKMAIRGSGAIFDACASVLVFDGQKGEPTRTAAPTLA